MVTAPLLLVVVGVVVARAGDRRVHGVGVRGGRDVVCPGRGRDPSGFDLVPLALSEYSRAALQGRHVPAEVAVRVLLPFPCADVEPADCAGGEIGGRRAREVTGVGVDLPAGHVEADGVSDMSVRPRTSSL